MNNSEKKDFKEALDAAFEMLGKPALSRPAMEMYWNSLVRFDLTTILNAISCHVQNTDNGQFTPKPADLIRAIEGTGQDKGMLAWSKVLDAIKRVGSHRSVCFDDPIIHSVVISMGGWIEINKVTDEELPFKANEFIKRYKAMCVPGNAVTHHKRLCGISEAHNDREGQKIAAPVLIGNKDSALLVYKSGGDGVAKDVTIFKSVGELLKLGVDRE